METILPIIKMAAYVISSWTALAVVIDTLDIIFSRDVTALSWYASHPLAIWKFGFGVNAFNGMLIWLVGIVITVLTAIFLI